MGSWEKFCSRRGTAFFNSLQAPDASRKNGPPYDATASGQLIYNYFRNYDATLGRYIESDLIGLRGGINTYAYALSDPLRHTDMRGLEVCEVEKGRYASCNASQQPNWPLWMNKILMESCKKTFDKMGCDKSPQTCCEADYNACAHEPVGTPRTVQELKRGVR
jgi:RHS repeat-associated protein